VVARSSALRWTIDRSRYGLSTTQVRGGESSAMALGYRSLADGQLARGCHGNRPRGACGGQIERFALDHRSLTGWPTGQRVTSNVSVVPVETGSQKLDKVVSGLRPSPE
jgi:hypothetical protein